MLELGKEAKRSAFSLSSVNISGGFLQSLRLGAAGGFACPPPPPPAGDCPPLPPPAGGCPPSLPPVGGCPTPLPPVGGAGMGAGAGAGAGGMLGSVTFPLVMCAANLECVCVAIVGSIGDC